MKGACLLLCYVAVVGVVKITSSAAATVGGVAMFASTRYCRV